MEPEVKYDRQIAVLKNEDDNILRHYFDLHYRSLFYFVQRLVQDSQEAEDIVADCFLKLWERIGDFQTANNVKAFLYISCRNASLNHIKHVSRKTAAQSLYAQQQEKGEEAILNHIIGAEVLDMIAKEIEALPEKCRAVFTRLHFEGKKTDEIAAELNLSAQTVRNHKTRALDLLKSAFLKKGLSDEVRLLLFLFIGLR